MPLGGYGGVKTLIEKNSPLPKLRGPLPKFTSHFTLKFSLPADLLAVRYATLSSRYRLYKNLHWYFGLK